MTAVKEWWVNHQDAPEEIKSHEDVALAAVQGRGRALFYASDGMKNKEHIVLAAVQHAHRPSDGGFYVGLPLDHFSEEMKNLLPTALLLMMVMMILWPLFEGCRQLLSMVPHS